MRRLLADGPCLGEGWSGKFVCRYDGFFVTEVCLPKALTLLVRWFSKQLVLVVPCLFSQFAHARLL